MAIMSNSPGLSYIAWSDCMVTYGEQTYIIQNDYTSEKYIYWDLSNPYYFITSDKILKDENNKYLLFVNEGGVYYEIKTAQDITLSFNDSNNPYLVTQKITSITDGDYEKRFTKIESDIEELKKMIESLKK